MKNGILTLLIIFLTINLLEAQKPQKILGIAKENKTAEYYQEQARLWRQVVDKDPSDGPAWFQLYRAEKSYWLRAEPETWAASPTTIFANLQPIIEELGRKLPDSYEYNYLRSANSRNPVDKKYLIRAYEIDPDRQEAYEGLLIYYYLSFKENEATAIARKMLEKNYFSNASLKWNYNGLMTAESNGIFIANGDMDALPKWVLQAGQNIRNDVLVISRPSLAFDAGYRQLVFDKLNIAPYPGQTPADMGLYSELLTIHIMKHAGRPVYMACGTDVSFFERQDIDTRMYLVGSAFLYSEKGLDNLSLCLKNFEEVYDLEYLHRNFQTHREDELVRTRMNVTYIPGLMKIKRHYEKTGDQKRLAWCDKLIDHIAQDSGRAEEIKSWY